MGVLFLGVKLPGREADHSLPSSAEFKECVELYLHSPIRLMAWCLVKHSDNFTFTLPMTKCYTGPREINNNNNNNNNNNKQAEFVYFCSSSLVIENEEFSSDLE
jgi:hypothetical protein